MISVTESDISLMVRNISEIATQYLQTECMVDNVPMDGNCMFSSLGLQLDRPVESSRDIRSEVVHYLESNREMVSIDSILVYTVLFGYQFTIIFLYLALFEKCTKINLSYSNEMYRTFCIMSQASSRELGSLLL